MTKYFITGGSGMLGSEIVNWLEKNGLEYRAPSSSEMNITHQYEVNEQILNYKPDVVIHCAAYTNVDRAEIDTKNCIEVNTNGTENLVIASALAGAKFVYISTDYVFSESRSGKPPFKPDCEYTNPLNMYGWTKEVGERIVKKYYQSFIIRVSGLFGKNGRNFVKTMLDLSETKDKINVVNDQITTPTYVKDLVEPIITIAATDKYGIYHLGNDDYCSWAELAQYVLRDANTKINPVNTEVYYESYRNSGKTYANRPLDSRLEKSEIYQLPHWKDAVDRYLEEIKGE